MNIKLKTIIVASLLFAAIGYLPAQKQEDIAFRAMNDEMKRNMEQLVLPDMQKPFFVTYTLIKNRSLRVQANSGGVLRKDFSNKSNIGVSMLVGNAHRSNAYFQNLNIPIFTGETSCDVDYDELRRGLWLSTDRAYNQAVMEYNQKMTQWKQMKVTEEMENLDDLSPLESLIKKRVPHRFVQEFSKKEYWENAIREVSAVFNKYPEIRDASALFFIQSKDYYILTSEGTELVLPEDYSNMQVVAQVVSDDGIVFKNCLDYEMLNDADMPSLDSMKRAADQMAQKLLAMKNAPKLEEAYDGPVLFEGMAPVIFFSSFLNYGDGLTSYRPTLVGQEKNALENKIGRKILPNNMTVKSVPGLKEFNGIKLYGSYEVDIQGVVPSEELVLVENGILRNVMSGRTPSIKTSKSNGHMFWGGQIKPGVIRFDVENGETKAQLKEKLIQLVKEEGLEYGYIVRFDGWNQVTAYYYKVYAADGREELVRNASLREPTIHQMKRITGICSEPMVANIRSGGIPTSIICPSALLLEDVEIVKDGFKGYDKKPIVSSPLEKK